jgi:hypothetical protein
VGYIELLRDVLNALREDNPTAYAVLCDTLTGFCLRLRIGGESALILGRLGGLQLFESAAIPEASAQPSALLRAEVGVCSDLLRGRTTLAAALRAERVWVQAKANDLHAVDDALRVFLMAALVSRRCRPSFQRLEQLEHHRKGF